MSQIQIVVPDGSMQDVISGLFAKAGLPVTVQNKRTKQGFVDVEWIERVIFQRPQEIPIYLNGGHFDVAIVGEDWIANWGMQSRFKVLAQLPVGRGGNRPVRIVLAVPETSGVQRAVDLPLGCEVATEYVQLTQAFFKSKGRRDIRVVPSFGNTEHKIGFGATAIVDVTESGNSLRENRLRVISEIMKSNTVIVANFKSYRDKSKRPYIDCFASLVYGAYQASLYVSLTANVPNGMLDQASDIMGGLTGPNCSPCIGKGAGWFTLQSTVPCTEEQSIIFKLLQIGVKGIRVDRNFPLIMS